MEPFLRLTAQHIYDKFGDNLSDIAVIFPNNRAKLFFSEHVYRLAGKPVWTPSFLTISNLFSSQSNLQLADTLTLVAHLYTVFKEISGRDESFDEFYLWGEVLLNDFDDVDKNRVDATQLFRNIKEQAAFTDTLEHLTEEQMEIVTRFFGHFDPNRKTALKNRFIENWNCLIQVYSLFQKRLEDQSLAYEGMLNRRVVDRLFSGEGGLFESESYLFVGFNVLNECEKALFKHLQRSEKALFYWDYDAIYLNAKEHEAGRFMRANLAAFPNQLPPTCFDHFHQSPKKIHFVASASENAQARYLPDWIQSLGADFKPEQTAIVLCNESLLLPVLYSIPTSIDAFNVTMGFPLNQAPVSNLVTRICQLHAAGTFRNKEGTTHYNYRYVLPILQHPLIKKASSNAVELESLIKEHHLFRTAASDLQKDPVLTAVFSTVNDSLTLADALTSTLTLLARESTPPTQTDTTLSEDPLMQESVFQCFTVVSRLKDALQQGLVQVGLPVFNALLQRVMSVTSIPFSGEPVRGLQVMGMLETRNLDFKNLLMLSVNEGMLPKTANDVSFIPYNLRKGFGLTTSDHKDSIFAYYFFRLLQRAEHITLVYNTSSDGLNRGEMSRFMLQLLAESTHPIETFQLHTHLGLNSGRTLQVDKNAPLMQKLRERFGKHGLGYLLSPTALNTYIDCSLRFYYRYVAGLKEQETVSDDIDGAMLGTLFHHAAEYLYTDVLLRKAGQPVTPLSVETARKEKSLFQKPEVPSSRGIISHQDLEPWLNGQRTLEQLAEHVMRTDFFLLPPDSDKKPDYNGEQLIRLRLLTHFLQTLIQADDTLTPFALVGMETNVQTEVTLSTASGTLTLNLGGTIDRLEEKEGCLNVIDYKTGGEPVIPKTIEDLFTPQEKRGNYVFQILLYCAIILRTQPGKRIMPRLLYINKAGSETYTSELIFGKAKEILADYAPYDEAFWSNLTGLLESIFDPATPFTQCKNPKLCEYCPYKPLCKR